MEESNCSFSVNFIRRIRQNSLRIPTRCISPFISRLLSDGFGRVMRNLCLTFQNDISPLQLACHYDHPNVANLLLEKGASPHLASQNGHTPLHIAARKNQVSPGQTRNTTEMILLTHRQIRRCLSLSMLGITFTRTTRLFHAARWTSLRLSWKTEQTQTRSPRRVSPRCI